MPKMLRETEHINRKTALNLMRAFDFARGLGIPFNTYVVINLVETDAMAAATAFEAIRHKYRGWLSRQARLRGIRLPPMYVFSFEAPGEPHVNWVLRIPPVLKEEFSRKLPSWVAKVQPVRKFDIKVQDVDAQRGYKKLANYIAKGCDPAFIDKYYLRELYDEHGSQGKFWGKRAGICPAFNKTAREASGWDDKKRRFRPTAVARSTPRSIPAAVVADAVA